MDVRYGTPILAVHCLSVPRGSATPTFFRRSRVPSWSSETHFYKAIAIAEAYGIECSQKESSISALAFCCGAVFRERFARLASLKQKRERSVDEW